MHELLDQPRLADSPAAAHRDQRAAPAALHIGEALAQQPQLPLSTGELLIAVYRPANFTTQKF